MRCHVSLIASIGLLGCAVAAPAHALLIRGATVYDGSGSAPVTADVRIDATRIVAVGRDLSPRPGEPEFDARGLALAPGFIDVHSHADGGLFDDPDAATLTRQGVTTILVGQDGESEVPLADWLARLEQRRPAVNVASMVGHATIRGEVMGKDLYRAAAADEVERMKSVLVRELEAGGFGLSTGLEYEEAHFATTEEVIALARVAGAAGGFYQSHVRDEANHVYRSFDELLRIGREAGLPVHITHIKLGSTPVWGTAPERMPALFAQARREGIDLSADVYPYTFWHSTLRVIVPDRDWFNAAKVERAIADNGGPASLRLGRYEPDPGLAGKTLEDVARLWNVTPAEAYMRMVRATDPAGGPAEESVLGTSMLESDVQWFIVQPGIMISSDGELDGAHPRGAGSFPRVLGHYARDRRALPLEAAIHKMTALPAARLGLQDRGCVAAGCVADLVLFDPATVIDRATIDAPATPPLGIPAVMVSGQWVVRDGKVTGARPGQVLRRTAQER